MEFDYSFYYKTNKDIQRFIYNNKVALSQYNTMGKYEGRLPNKDIFQWEYYLDKYEDLGKANIKTPEHALAHYIRWGRLEGRSFLKNPNDEHRDNFNHEEYLNKHLELLNTDKKIDRVFALRHFMNNINKKEVTSRAINTINKNQAN